MTNSTVGDARPQKPHADFPLYAHKTRRWAKKVRGKTHFFGAWNDPQGALNRWLDVKDDLLAGRSPRPKDGSLTVRDLCNRFLDSKKTRLDAGEISIHTWDYYVPVCKKIVAAIGDRPITTLRPDDFEQLRAHFSKTLGLAILSNTLSVSRGIFGFAYKQGLVEKPFQFGDAFKRPNPKAVRAARTAKMFEAAEIRRILESTSGIFRAVTLLGINCAFGPGDIGRLTFDVVDLKAGWVDYPRPKTGVARRCPLWAETVAALEEVISTQPDPATGCEQLIFLTARGHSWFKRSSYLSNQYVKLVLKPLGLYQRRVGIYGLRHAFRTIADGCRDFPACDLLMGHADSSMAGRYRERIDDSRLVEVVEHVHRWLYAESEAEGEPDILKFSTQSKIG